ncbi:MAG: hypothetical protein NUV55_05925 [Sulfuricaulis sp.]|uniref:hypothetical protein n=1 Tax=Sulfuricaulis sp. TaxID=2003553 RepID=UPI0025D26F15|nr:hypothetical protein [Sulfuricaulis sp.]MCR4346722.1 hypothetical protein [Sulfuricaulis sp.]
MRLRRLNEKGIEELGMYLDALADNPMLTPPAEILEDQAKSESLSVKVDIDSKKFSNRFDAAKYLYDKFIEAGVADSDLDRGVWAWLSLFWFDTLRPPAGKQAKKWPGERARWIPSESHDWKKFYRHLLAGPWRVYRFHRDNPERARVVLCGPLYAPGEASEQILSRQEVVTNRSVVELATRMYYDPIGKKVKRGAASKGAGTFRRFANDFLNQFDMTWDLYAMTADQVATLLPKEFNRFLSERR